MQSCSTLHELDMVANKTTKRSSPTWTTCSVHIANLTTFDSTFMNMTTSMRDPLVTIQMIDMDVWMHKFGLEVLDHWTSFNNFFFAIEYSWKIQVGVQYIQYGYMWYSSPIMCRYMESNVIINAFSLPFVWWRRTHLMFFVFMMDWSASHTETFDFTPSL